MMRSCFSARSTKEDTQGSVAILRDKKTLKARISNIRSNVFHCTESWRIGIERFDGTHLKFSRYKWYKIIFDEEKDNLVTVFKKRISWAKSLRDRFGGTILWRNLRTSEKMCKLKSNIKVRFIFLWRRQRHRRAYVYCVFGSFHTQYWERRFVLRYNKYFEKVQNPPPPMYDLPRLGDSTNKRVSKSFCAWSRSVRNSAITRWKGIHLSGKRRNSVIGPKWVGKY